MKPFNDGKNNYPAKYLTLGTYTVTGQYTPLPDYDTLASIHAPHMEDDNSIQDISLGVSSITCTVKADLDCQFPIMLENWEISGGKYSIPLIESKIKHNLYLYGFDKLLNRIDHPHAYEPGAIFTCVMGIEK